MKKIITPQWGKPYEKDGNWYRKCTVTGRVQRAIDVRKWVDIESDGK